MTGASMTKDERAISRWVEEAMCSIANSGNVLLPEIPPQVQQHTTRRISTRWNFSWGVSDLCPISGTAALGSYTWETSPPNIKPMGIVPRRTIELWVVENLPHMGWHTESLMLGPSTKAEVWKAPRLWKTLTTAGNRKLLRLSQGMEVLAGALFVVLLC